MADEINSATASEAAVAPATPVKKQRAPRAKKVDAAASTSEPVKKNRGGRPKRTEAAAAPATAAAPKTRGKRAASLTPVAGKRGPNRAAKSAAVSSPLADDLSDLLQLEEENRRLRQALAEKLRAENADLRSRLGQK